MGRAITGVQGAGYQPVWVIADSAITGINDQSTSIPLSAVTGGVKIDCYYNLGGVELNREAETKERQRACQKVVEEIKIASKINGTIEAVWDQQKAPEDEVNKAYTALPEGGSAWLFVAHGWDSDVAPDTTTKGDLWHVNIQQKDHPFAADNEAEITFIATLTGDQYNADMALTAP